MKQVFSYLPIIILVLLIAGCSDKLTKNKAEEVIKEVIKFPITEKERIPYGLVVHDRDSLTRAYYRLADKGFFKIEYIGDRSGFPFGQEYLFRVTPLDEAKKYYKEDSSPMKDEQSDEMKYIGWFKTCDVEFESVKEIREVPAFNGAEIAYQVRRINFTPFWEVYLSGSLPMPDTVQIKSFSAIKTNEGWKAARYKWSVNQFY